MVLERGGIAVAGVEVKAAASVADADSCGLRKLREAARPRFAAGVVLLRRRGASVVRFDDQLFAVPVRTQWEGA